MREVNWALPNFGKAHDAFVWLKEVEKNPFRRLNES